MVCGVVEWVNKQCAVLFEGMFCSVQLSFTDNRPTSVKGTNTLFFEWDFYFE